MNYARLNRSRFTKVTSLFLTAAMSFTLIPSLLGTQDVSAAPDGIGLKPLDYLMLGTSKMASPREPESAKDSWNGSYVVFGKYHNTNTNALATAEMQLRFRVLDPDTTKFGKNGERSLFLDCDYALYVDKFNNVDDPTDEVPNPADYSSSQIRANLEENFLNKEGVFTDLERSAIMESYVGTHKIKDAGIADEEIYRFDHYEDYTPLNGDKVFLLDVEDISNKKYGYTDKVSDLNDDTRYFNRIKTSFVEGVSPWVTRSGQSTGNSSSMNMIGYVDDQGNIRNTKCTQTRYYVSPAMNISMDDILFSRAVEGDMGELGTEYNLFLIDDSMEVKLTGDASIEGNTITVPNEYTAPKTGVPSVFITDKEYKAEGAEIYYINVLADSKFDLPEGIQGTWGEDYHIYATIIAPNEKGNVASVAASKPVEIKNPSLTSKEEPADEPTNEPDPIAQPSAKNDIEAFVTRIYDNILDREPDKDGFEFWVNELYNFKRSGGEVAQGFIFSPEFIDRKTSDKEFLEILYKTFFDRQPDEGGMNFWLDQLATGKMDRTAVANGFIFSQEWANTCAKYGIRSGGSILPNVHIDPSPEVLAFVERLYTTALGRPSEEEGLNFWADGLANYKCSAEQVGAAFFLSEEIKGYNLSDEEYVTRLYKTFTDREPDTEGFKFWVGYLAQGHSREEVVMGFTRSTEFVNRCIDARVYPY